MYDYARWLSKTYGIGVQITAHHLDGDNSHFHLTLTSCAVLPDGTFGKKVRRLDPIAMQRDKEESPAETLRATWADMVNKAYAEAGVVEHVDHRSYTRRGISKIPTVHEGVWHHAPCPVNPPDKLNAAIQLCKHAIGECEQLVTQQEAIRNALQQARLTETAATTAVDETAGKTSQPQPTNHDGGKQTEVPSTASPSSKPQDAPAPLISQQPWHSRAWEMIVDFARTMPTSDRESELLGACLQFCEKYPKATADYIEKVLTLHSRNPVEAQRRIIAHVAAFIAGREKQALDAQKQEATWAGWTLAAPQASSQPLKTASQQPAKALSAPENPAMSQGTKPELQPVEATASVPPHAAPNLATNVANHVKQDSVSSPLLTLHEKVAEDPAGPSLRSALQAYCEQHTEQAREAGELGETRRRDAIMASLRSPVGDQLAGLRRWLFRHYPAVAQETAKRLSLARRTLNSEDRLSALESVFRYLPPDFVRNRLSIGMQEDSTDTVADVAAAMNCTRSESIKRLASVMPDLLRIPNGTAGKNATWLDCISIHEQQELAHNNPTQEE